MKPRDVWIGAAAWVALMLATVFLFEAPMARAQTRHDADQAWIRKTLRDERRKEWEREDGMRDHGVHARPAGGWVSPSRRRPYIVVERREPPEHSSTRVYGMVMRRSQFVERHATSHVECFPPVQEQSGDFANDDKALAEAEVRWQAKVAVQYGMAWADFSNATHRQKMCFRSTFDESWWGRNKEAASQRLGISDGYKKRCTITASPCRAPTQEIDQSRVESRTDTRTEIVEPPRR